MAEPAQPAEPVAPVDEMLVSISFAVRLGDFFKEADPDQLVAETRRMLTQMTESLLSQHPHAHLHGDIGVNILLNRA